MIFDLCHDDDCFYYHSWRNNVVIAFGTLSSFLFEYCLAFTMTCTVCSARDPPSSLFPLLSFFYSYKFRFIIVQENIFTAELKMGRPHPSFFPTCTTQPSRTLCLPLTYHHWSFYFTQRYYILPQEK